MSINKSCTSCNDLHVPFRFQIRIVSVVVVIGGLMQLVLGLNIYTTITKPLYGNGWYSGFSLLVTGIIGIFVKNRGTAIATWSFSLISIIISLLSTGMDCVNSDTLLTLQTCVATSNLYNPDIYVYSGNNDFDINAAICMTNYYDSNADNGCYCATAKNTCYPFYGVSNCNTVLSQVTDRLNALCFLDTASTCVIFALSLLLFISLYIHPKQVNESDKDAIKRTQGLLKQKVMEEKMKAIEDQKKLEMKTSINHAFDTDRESTIDFGSHNPLAGGMNPLAGGVNPLADK